MSLISRLRIFICLFFGLALLTVSLAQTTQPEEPIIIERSSPYEVYQSFVGATERLENDYTNYINNKNADSLKILLNDLSRIRQLLDLSSTPPATKIRTGDNAITYLYDILARLPSVNPETIPGYTSKDEQSNTKDLPIRWTIPGTEIQIVRMEDGPFSGEYQFSAASIENMAHYYDAFKNLPILNKRKYSFFYQEYSNSTGALIPESFANVFPEWLQKPYFDTPAWKILIMGVINLVLLILAITWTRFVFALAQPVTGLKRTGRLLLIPIVLIALLYGSDIFITKQLNPVGTLASSEGLTYTILYYCLFAWIAWLFIYFIADTVIGILHQLSRDYDEALIKLSVKLIATIAVITILINGADQVGIPALGIIAGFGVGGIAVALASQSTLENIFGGLSLFADRPFSVGDKIFFNDQSAKVLRIGPRSTRLRTRDGALCTVPNSDLAKMHIINLTLRNCFYIKQTVSLNNSSSPEKIRNLLLKIRERLAREELVEHKEGWPRVQMVGTGLGRININIRAIVLTTEYSDFLYIQESIMLDVLVYIEQLDLKLANVFYKQT